MQGRFLTIVVGVVAVAVVVALIFLRPAPEPLRSPPTVSVAALSIASPLGDKPLGRADAPVTVVEYASLTCSHCQNFRQTVFPAFAQRYIDTGRVRFLLREFPRDDLDLTAFTLARCAPGENGYHGLIDRLFERQGDWAFVASPGAALRQLALQSGFTPESFDACLANQAVIDGVVWSRDRAIAEFGVNATPTFFINGEQLVGEPSIAALQAAIDSKLP